MNLVELLTHALLITFGAIGVMQWVKAVLKAFKAKKNRTVVLISPLVAAATAFTSLIGAENYLATAFEMTWFVLSLTQLGYELVIETVLAWIQRLKNSAGPPAAGSS